MPGIKHVYGEELSVINCDEQCLNILLVDEMIENRNVAELRLKIKPAPIPQSPSLIQLPVRKIPLIYKKTIKYAMS